MWTKHFSFFIMRRSTPKMGSKHFSNLIQLLKLRNLICYFIGYFFFIYSEVSDALLIQSQYWKGSQNIVELFQYWSLNHLCFSAHSTFVSQHPPPLLRKVQKIQLCYCNSHFKIFKMKFFFNILKSLTLEFRIKSQEIQQ